MRAALVAVCLCFLPAAAASPPSAARRWNEALLAAIRVDFARPTVHARNLFHTSIAIYDAWAAYDDTARPFLLGRTVGRFACPFAGVPVPADLRAARQEALSYAAYRLLRHRFRDSPGAARSLARFDALLDSLGYDPDVTTTDYASGSPAALGNYIGGRLIDFGLQDGANESTGYGNRFYTPVNLPLIPLLPGNPDIFDRNRWQPLTLELFIDQSGNQIPGKTPPFLSPEWGAVTPFALGPEDLTVYRRGGRQYRVYHDPGPPALLGTATGPEYQWNHTLVAVWSSHLDPADGVVIDISPAALGNVPFEALPRTLADLRSFYDLLEGGDSGTGRPLNPRTGQPYAPQLVPRGDYTRVLAEFWADGPDSETPPGHWFAILNYVNDHPLFAKRFGGQGPILDDLEWDAKAYFVLGGAVHDAAVAAWGIKGWYDYVRPISAIRAMADRGQSSDPALPSYDPEGLPLIPGAVERVEAEDPLDGFGANVGKVKVRAWRGPGRVEDPRTDVAGVDWILAEDWWPYQRPSFVTPPFAGYVSGHSTFSRAAAEVMTLLTGDEYFPGGMGQFHAAKDEFLVFEDGPSVDVTLQWATYRDASDQTSLSRIWGGIHPPVDDIPGRLIGHDVGIEAFHYAEGFFRGDAILTAPDTAAATPSTSAPATLAAWPCPVVRGGALSIGLSAAPEGASLRLYDVLGQTVRSIPLAGRQQLQLDTGGLAAGIYFLRLSGARLSGAPVRVLVVE